MSIHQIPPGVDMDKLPRLLRRYLYEPDPVVYVRADGVHPTTIEFVPDLTAEQIATLDVIFVLADCPVDWTPGDRTVYLNNKPTLQAYLGLTNPTTAQTVAALKALIRVVAAIVRN